MSLKCPSTYRVLCQWNVPLLIMWYVTETSLYLPCGMSLKCPSTYRVICYWNVPLIVWYITEMSLYVPIVSPSLINSCMHPLCLSSPQWEAADTEIKVPSGENTQLKRSPFKAWSRSVYSHPARHSLQQGISSMFISSLLVHSSAFFPNTSPDFFLCWLWLTPVPV